MRIRLALLAVVVGCGARSNLTSDYEPGPVATATATAGNTPTPAQPVAVDCKALRDAEWGYDFGLAAPQHIDLSQIRTLPPGARPEVRAMAGDCTGAWIVVDANARGGSQRYVIRTNKDGGYERSAALTQGSGYGDATLAVDFVSQLAGLFLQSEGSDYFWKLDAPGFEAMGPGVTLGSRSVDTPRGGFASDRGYSSLSVTERGTNQVSKIGVAPDGSVLSPVRLNVERASFVQNVTRSAYNDGSYTLVYWGTGRGGYYVNTQYFAANDKASPTVAHQASGYPLGVATTNEGFALAESTGQAVLFTWLSKEGKVLNEMRVTYTGRNGSMASVQGSLLVVEPIDVDSKGPAIKLNNLRPGRAARQSALDLTQSVTSSKITQAGESGQIAWTDGTANLYVSRITREAF